MAAAAFQIRLLWRCWPPASCHVRALGTGPSRESLYDLLNLDREMSHGEVKKAYHLAAMRWHPDRALAGSEEAAHERFARLQAAWERYDSSRVRNFKRRRKVGDDSDPSKQRFGVGCSWTDDDKEKAERASVIDQAARGITYRPTLPPVYDTER